MTVPKRKARRKAPETETAEAPETGRQAAAIAALLAEASVSAAAKKIGVGEKTLRRWMELPAFKAAYRAARVDVVEGAAARLQRAAGKAVETLEALLRCKHNSTR